MGWGAGRKRIGVTSVKPKPNCKDNMGLKDPVKGYKQIEEFPGRFYTAYVQNCPAHTGGITTGSLTKCWCMDCQAITSCSGNSWGSVHTWSLVTLNR